MLQLRKIMGAYYMEASEGQTTVTREQKREPKNAGGSLEVLFVKAWKIHICGILSR